MSNRCEKMVTSNFSFSHSAFYPMKDKFNVLCNILFVICKRFQIGQG